jgi:hypothetical protein
MGVVLRESSLSVATSPELPALFRRAGGGTTKPDLPVSAEAEGGEDGGGCPSRLCHLLLTPSDTHGGSHF